MQYAVNSSPASATIKEPGIDANQFLVFLFDGILPDIDESVVTWSLLAEAEIETNAFDG